VFGQHAVDEILIDVDPERVRKDPSDARTAEARLRDFSSAIARMSASFGPFWPGFLVVGAGENSLRYLRRTKA
jgi:hypothetical protein